MRSLQDTIEEATRLGWMGKPAISWRIDDVVGVKNTSVSILKQRIGNQQPVWLPEYDKIIQWFCAPNGKGICVLGQNGLGKTVFAMTILPTMILHYTNLVSFVCSAVTLKDEIDKIVTGNHRLIVVDDVGTESVESNHYGNKSAPFAELMDYVEKNKAILIMTSNLGAAKLEERYGTRTYERILGNMVSVAINGESFRRNKAQQSN